MGRGHLIRPLGGGLLIAMLALPVIPAAIAVGAPAVTISAVNVGPGSQTYPHVSGEWVSYSDDAVEGVRFQNLALGASSDRLIPLPDGFSDSLPDISDRTVVFMRVGGGVQAIDEVQIDAAGNPSAATEVAPSDGALRRRPAIGGDTVAWEEGVYDASGAAQTEIGVASASDPARPAYRLTDDAVNDQWPAVSPDGNAVVWLKCAATSTCDVWRAERSQGAWGAPEQVTGTAGNESAPDTNGPVTVYASTAGGDDNIRWSVKGPNGYVESVLDLPGVQRNPSIAGHYIVFESSAAPGEQYDVWLYDMETSSMRQLTSTAMSETLTDVAVSDGGSVRVAWAIARSVSPYDMDVYATSALEWTAPTIAAAVSGGTTGNDGWYTSAVTVHFTCADAGSGIPEGACPGDEVLDTDGASVSSTARTVTDTAGNVSEPSNVVTVKIDRTAPTGSVVIDDGAPSTSSADATLGLAAADGGGSGVAQVRVADTSDGLVSAAWEPYAPSRSYTLPGGGGTKTVYAQFRDAAGNVSEVYADDIVLEETAPAATVTIVDPGPDRTIQDRFTFTATMTEVGGSPRAVSFSVRADDGTEDGRAIGFEHLAATRGGSGTFALAFQTWRLPDGRYLLLADGTDGAGNAVSAPPAHFRIANVTLDRLASVTGSGSHAGQIVPVRFSLTQVCRNALVSNEALTIIVRAKGSSQVLQRSTFGPAAGDYGIDAATGLYTVNFQTRATPATYVVEVWRQTPLVSVPVGAIEFKTVK